MYMETELNGVKVITLYGRFDAIKSDVFKRYIDSLTENCESDNFVIDMSKVSYMNCIGFDSILYTLRKIKEQRGNLKIVCIDAIFSVFQFTRGHRLIEIYDDTQIAVSSFDVS